MCVTVQEKVPVVLQTAVPQKMTTYTKEAPKMQTLSVSNCRIVTFHSKFSDDSSSNLNLELSS